MKMSNFIFLNDFFSVQNIVTLPSLSRPGKGIGVPQVNKFEQIWEKPIWEGVPM